MEQVMLTCLIHMMTEMMMRRQGLWRSTRALSCISCRRLDLEWILLR
uniref:Alternative protein OSBPL9 n=1 Tax=Homo sapiens TaxID=9606 RepID=L8EBE2_HUMAN|nr:alternative protein OSBPL9 [Homo sapiens]